MLTGQSRREFLTALTAVGAAGVLGARRSLADEGPPETTAIRLAYYKNNCLAPLLVAEDLLRLEGFTEIKYVSVPKSFLTPELVARGECNFANTFAGTLVSYLDNGLPITALSGVHAGCYELFAHGFAEGFGATDPPLQRAQYRRLIAQQIACAGSFRLQVESIPLRVISQQ